MQILFLNYILKIQKKYQNTCIYQKKVVLLQSQIVH